MSANLNLFNFNGLSDLNEEELLQLALSASLESSPSNIPLGTAGSTIEQSGSMPFPSSALSPTSATPTQFSLMPNLHLDRTKDNEPKLTHDQVLLRTEKEKEKTKEIDQKRERELERERAHQKLMKKNKIQECTDSLSTQLQAIQNLAQQSGSFKYTTNITTEVGGNNEKSIPQALAQQRNISGNLDLDLIRAIEESALEESTTNIAEEASLENNSDVYKTASKTNLPASQIYRATESPTSMITDEMLYELAYGGDLSSTPKEPSPETEKEKALKLSVLTAQTEAMARQEKENKNKKETQRIIEDSIASFNSAERQREATRLELEHQALLAIEESFKMLKTNAKISPDGKESTGKITKNAVEAVIEEEVETLRQFNASRQKSANAAETENRSANTTTATATANPANPTKSGTSGDLR